MHSAPAGLFFSGNSPQGANREAGSKDEYKSKRLPHAPWNFRMEGDIYGVPFKNIRAAEGESSLHMGLEYQSRMLPQPMELNKLPAFLSHAQFRSE